MTSPTAGTVIPAPASPQIEWAGPPGVPVIALVLDAIPADDIELRNHTIWGAARSGAQPSAVRWLDGHPVSNGNWLPATPGALAPGGYYLLTESVQQGELLAMSVLVPFWVGDGSPWKVERDACGSPGVPGDCDSPADPLACSNNRCRKLCASHDDCDGRFCLPPEGLMRFCEQ